MPKEECIDCEIEISAGDMLCDDCREKRHGHIVTPNEIYTRRERKQERYAYYDDCPHCGGGSCEECSPYPEVR